MKCVGCCRWCQRSRVCDLLACFYTLHFLFTTICRPLSGYYSCSYTTLLRPPFIHTFYIFINDIHPKLQDFLANFIKFLVSGNTFLISVTCQARVAELRTPWSPPAHDHAHSLAIAPLNMVITVASRSSTPSHSVVKMFVYFIKLNWGHFWKQTRLGLHIWVLGCECNGKQMLLMWWRCEIIMMNNVAHSTRELRLVWWNRLLVWFILYEDIGWHSSDFYRSIIHALMWIQRRNKHAAVQSLRSGVISEDLLPRLSQVIHHALSSGNITRVWDYVVWLCQVARTSSMRRSPSSGPMSFSGSSKCKARQTSCLCTWPSTSTWRWSGLRRAKRRRMAWRPSSTSGWRSFPFRENLGFLWEDCLPHHKHGTKEVVFLLSFPAHLWFSN